MKSRRVKSSCLNIIFVHQTNMAEMIELVDILVLKLAILRLTDHHNRPDKNNTNQYE